MSNDILTQKIADDIEKEKYILKYKKKIKKLKKMYKKSSNQVEELEDEIDCLKEALKKSKKKFKQLKKSIQMERYEYGVNPFIPYDMSKAKHKGKKHKNCFIPRIQHIMLTPTMIPNLTMEKELNVVDGKYREICQQNLK